MSFQGLPLVDTFGRVHDNLRISVTDRCNIRCFYCMPAEHVSFLPKPQLLTFEEITRFVKVAVSMGVRKVRLTGGEPLVRQELSSLVAQLSEIEGVDDIGLTTNGVLLEEQAEELYTAGLRRLNVSLDALDPVKFKAITRREGYEKVMRGLTKAREVGFEKIKINAVSIRGMTETEIVPFGQFARQTGMEVRFIEYMPLDAERAWEREKVLFAQELLAVLSSEIRTLVPVGEFDPHAPASEYVFEDGIGKIGFISSVSQPFCGSCNRFRLTADGKIRNCLFSLEETDIKFLLRGGASDDEIREAVRGSIWDKKEGHEINAAKYVWPDRAMYSIGG